LKALNFERSFSILVAVLISTILVCTPAISDNQPNQSSHASILTQNNQGITLSFDLSDVNQSVRLVEDEPHDVFEFQNEGMALRDGQPILPAITRLVVVPPDVGLSLVINYDSPRTTEGLNSPELYKSESAEDQYIDADIDPNGLFPAVIAEMSDPMVIRGVRFVSVTTYPVQFNIEANEYVIYDRIETEIQFTNDEPVNPVRVPVRSNRSQQFLKLIRNLAINGDQVCRDDPDLDREPENVGHYLIVVHENCLEHIADFIEWRRKSGWRVDIYSVPANLAGDGDIVKRGVEDRYNAYLDDGIDPFDEILMVGDIQRYPFGNAQWRLASHSRTDYSYACLEGNDLIPDAGISRWCAGDPDMLGLFQGRTLAYEANPYMENTDWFGRVGVFSSHWGASVNSGWHPSINTNVRWLFEVFSYLGFEDIRFFEDFEWDQLGVRVSQWELERYHEDCNMLMGRSEGYWWAYRDNMVRLQSSNVFPIRIATMGHGDRVVPVLMRQGGPGNLKGPVAATSSYGNPSTISMNIGMLETSHGLLLNDLTLGWSRLQAMIGSIAYVGNDRVIAELRDVFDMYGDPGLQPWLAVPRVVNAEVPETITPATKLIEVYVHDINDNEIAVQDAQVTLYAPGDMPNFNSNNYASYDEMLMITRKSDENGLARFYLDEEVEFVDGTSLNITVTGRTIKPHFDEIEIVEPGSGIELTDWSIIQIEGNDDAEPNPGEMFALSFSVRNLSRRNALQNISANCSSLSSYLSCDDNNAIELGDIDADQVVEIEEGINFTISSDCPDGISRPITRPLIQIVFSSEEESWTTAIQLDVLSPDLAISRIIGGNVIEEDDNSVNIEVENIGRIPMPATTATLISIGGGIIVEEAEGEYPAIDAGEDARMDGRGFGIACSQYVVPGSMCDMMIIFETENGFLDSVFFSLQVLEEHANAPQGPDTYGYICLDNTDREWEKAPVYNWEEISLQDDDRDSDGVRLEFEGRSPYNIGETIVISLPFETQFYGQLYDSISVSTNGFISMGNQELITNFQNWPLDRALGGGVGMIAPLWDDLTLTGNGNVYTFYDDENNRFIVEWYRLRHRFGGNRDLSFQVVLYDNNFWITQTGDQDILFQYKLVSNVRGNANWTNDVPYASVGISGPGAGINYAFNNRYPVTSAPLADRRALLFTTSLDNRVGDLFGRVIDAATEQPIQEVSFRTNHGFYTVSDENGTWRIENCLVGIPFNITSSKQGYNDSTLSNIELAEGGELEINFELLHPEFECSINEVSEGLSEGEVFNIEFELINNGNGPLEWDAEKLLRDGGNHEQWELRRQYPVGQDLEDNRINGIVFVDDRYYVAGSNDRDPQIYILNDEGRLIDRYDQFGQNGRYGYKDLTFDSEWIWGSGSSEIYAFTIEGELRREFEGPVNPVNNFAWDSDREVLWVSGITSDIISLDRDGNVIGDLDRLGMRIYGLGYWPDDPDGYPLYIFHKVRDIGDQVVTKMNPRNNDTLFVNVLEPENGGTPSGVFCTNQFDVYSTVFMGSINDGANDRVDIWQLDVRRDWFELDLKNGVINPDGSQEVVLTLDATDISEDIIFEADVRFIHNANDGIFNLPITLEVLGGERILELDLVEGWNLISINVVPDNPNVRDITRPLVNEGVLILLKNGIGQFYLPEQDFCNINEWEVSDGYLIKVTDVALLEVRGEAIPVDQPIALRQGWNMSAYFPRQAVNAVTSLAGIADNLIIAKDGFGRFYLPEFGFSNMGNLQVGLGYQYNVREAIELVYQVGEEVALAGLDVIHPKHFGTVTPTGENMSIYLSGIPQMSEFEIGIFTPGGMLVGSGRIDRNGNFGIAVWGDDVITDVIDGAVELDALSFILWDGKKESNLSPTPISGKPVWAENGLMTGKIASTAAAPVAFGIHETYPNPTNGPVRLSIGLEKYGDISLRVYNLSGRLVTTLVQGRYKTGNHQVVWDTDVVSSGLYLVELNATGRSHIEKIAVLK